MRILILGGTGMLGHCLWRQWRDSHEVWATSRSSYDRWSGWELFDRRRFLGGLDVLNSDMLIRAVGAVRPDVIVNCVGIVKQLQEAKDPLQSLTVNSLFPHRAADLAIALGARLVHISTDCVFSGRDGNYTEDDVSDAEDLYGRTKFLGEVGGPGVITLRTSIIGRELETRSGLVEWFLSTKEQVRGFERAIYTGLTTAELGRVIMNLLEHHPDLGGVWQVSSERITKYDLLHLLRDAFDHRVQIDRDQSVEIDRSLDSSRFRQATGYQPPAWPDMIAELASDRGFYDNRGRSRVA